MIIEKVIISSNQNSNYLSFWPLVKKAWSNIGIDPLLIYVGQKPIDLCSDPNVVYFDSGDIDTGFVARNIRMLYPALFPEKICLLSDIDLVPLDKNYFTTNIIHNNDDVLLMLRDNLTTNDQIPICWNVAKGSTWREIFNIRTEKDIQSLITQWDEKITDNKKMYWYNDQIMLKSYIKKFEKNNIHRIVKTTDEVTNFKRIDRSNYTNTITSVLKNEKFTDYHMPTPYKENRLGINIIYNHFQFNNKNKLITKYSLIAYLISKRFVLVLKSLINR